MWAAAAESSPGLVLFKAAAAHRGPKAHTKSPWAAPASQTLPHGGRAVFHKHFPKNHRERNEQLCRLASSTQEVSSKSPEPGLTTNCSAGPSGPGPCASARAPAGVTAAAYILVIFLLRVLASTHWKIGTDIAIRSRFFSSNESAGKFCGCSSISSARLSALV